MAGVVTKKEHRCFEGLQGFYEHQSTACAGPMRFAVYQPPAALRGERVPVLYYLAGLTCSEETFAIKSGAQRVAAELGLALVSCDTSPRATRLPGRRRGGRLRPGRGVLSRRDGGALVDGVPDVHLPDARPARGGGVEFSGRRRAARNLRPLDGRTRRAGDRAAQPRRLPERLGLRPRRHAERGALGAEGLRRLPRRGPRGLARMGRHRAGARRSPRSTGRSWSIRGRPIRFWRSSSAPSCSRPPAPRPGSRCELARRDGYDHGYFFVSSFIERHLRWHHELLTEARTAT